MQALTSHFTFPQTLLSLINKFPVIPVDNSLDLPSKQNLAFSGILKATHILNLSVEDNFGGSGLKVIHVAGTKGKGSTCIFCESILVKSGLNVGLFTSPHLIKVNERFRVNGKQISDELMQEVVDFVYKTLESQDALLGYYKFLTVLAFYLYTNKALLRKYYGFEKLDVLILEVGIGGLLDATNVLKHKAATAVTLLDYDHMEFLGNTIEEIAAQKAGIFIESCPAFTVPNHPEAALNVLKDVAGKVKCPLTIVNYKENSLLDDVKLGIAGEHQKQNAALAAAVCTEVLRGYEHSTESTKNFIREGLTSARHAGRCQILKATEKVCFYLDGAHTPQSMICATKWFESEMASGSYIHSSEVVKILIFNCAFTKSAKDLLGTLARSTVTFDFVYFTTGDSFKVTTSKRPTFADIVKPFNENVIHQTNEENETWQQTCSRVWKYFTANKFSYQKVEAQVKLNDVISCILKENDKVAKVFVTGSLLLVGDTLKALQYEV